jgi:hypothetical protein
MKNYWLTEMVKNTNYKMAPAEQEFVNALISIAKKYGKLSNSDGNGIWVGYVDASENDNASIGVKCSNCTLYEGAGVCKIVKQKVQDGGYCRLAAIPDGVVNKDNNDDDDQGDDEED